MFKYLSAVITAIVFLLFLVGCQQHSTDPVDDNSFLLKPGGSALSFNGIDGYVNVPNDLSLNATNELTISAWVYFDGEYPIEYSSIVTKGDNTGISSVNNNYTLHSSGDGRFYLTATTSGGGGFQVNSTNSPLDLNTWYHIGVSFAYDGAIGVVRFYINGSFVNEVSGPLDGTLLPNDAPLTIGVDFPINTEYWKGNIDEVKIWNEVLTESQITQAMSAATPRARSLMGYWRFNEGSGLTVRDRSSNHNDGTLVGGVSWIFPGAI